MGHSRAFGVARVVRIFRDHVDKEASVQKLSVFLEIATSPGIDNGTLIHRLDLSRSNASKLIRDLTDFTALKKPGPGVVRQEIDPMDMTRRMSFLTEKGERIFKLMLEAL